MVTTQWYSISMHVVLFFFEFLFSLSYSFSLRTSAIILFVILFMLTFFRRCCCFHNIHKKTQTVSIVYQYVVWLPSCSVCLWLYIISWCMAFIFLDVIFLYRAYLYMVYSISLPMASPLNGISISISTYSSHTIILLSTAQLRLIISAN